MTIEQQNAINIAVVQAEMTHVKTGMVDLKAESAQQNVKLDTIMRKMDEVKGGYRALLMLGSVAGMMGGGMTWVISHWKG